MTGPARDRPAGPHDRRPARRSSARSTGSTSTRRSIEYAVRLVDRDPRRRAAYGLPELERYITYGASPRASINLILTARALAFVRGRDYALPQDVARHGPRRHAPPARAVVRGALRRRHRRRHPVDRSSAASRCPVRPRSREQSQRPRQRLSASSSASTGRSSAGSTACSRATTGPCSAATGVDLADLREYQPGDDVRYIDWNVTARMDTPYVREYHEDREITAWFLLDLSPSVDFGTVDGERQKRTVLDRLRRRRWPGC